MENRRISRNAAVAAAQVAVTSLFLFILYRYLLANLGIARVGVWSVVMAYLPVSPPDGGTPMLNPPTTPHTITETHGEAITFWLARTAAVGGLARGS